MNKIAVVGCGNVGVTYAYSLITTGANIDELVLIDINKEKAEAEALDLCHAINFAPRNIKIYAGDYSDLDNASIVCVCAGKNRQIQQSRDELLFDNFEIIKDIVYKINKTKFNGIYLIASNPLDAMTYAVKRLSNLPENRVIGSGTTLDSNRLNYLISKKLNVNPKDIHGYVIGEHGQSAFVSWEDILIGCNKINDFLSNEEMTKIEQEVRDSATQIIKGKGYTNFGVASCLLQITNAIINNTNEILTVSVYDSSYDICYSKPCIVNREGANKNIDIDLTEQDYLQLNKTFNKLKDTKNLIFKN